MGAMQQRGMPVGFGVPNAAQTAESAHSGLGREANAGANTQKAIRSAHAKLGHGGMAAHMSENPALETKAPGYRPRVT